MVGKGAVQLYIVKKTNNYYSRFTNNYNVRRRPCRRGIEILRLRACIHASDHIHLHTCMRDQWRNAVDSFTTVLEYPITSERAAAAVLVRCPLRYQLGYVHAVPSKSRRGLAPSVAKNQCLFTVPPRLDTRVRHRSSAGVWRDMGTIL